MPAFTLNLLKYGEIVKRESFVKEQDNDHVKKFPADVKPVGPKARGVHASVKGRQPLKKGCVRRQRSKVTRRVVTTTNAGMK